MLKPCSLSLLLDHPFADSVPELFDFFSAQGILPEFITVRERRNDGTVVMLQFSQGKEHLKETIELLARQKTVLKIEVLKVRG